MLHELKQKYLELISKANENGIPMPTARDPSTGKGSVTATMAVVSFFFVLLSSSKQASESLGVLEFSNLLSLFVSCMLFYTVRRFSFSKKGNDVDLKVEEKSGESK